MKTFFQILLLSVCVLGLRAAPLEIDGMMIDIRPVKKGEPVFPQQTGMRYGEIPPALANTQAAVGLQGYPSVSAVRAEKAGEVLVGLPTRDFSGDGWVNTGTQVPVSGKRSYTLYTHCYDTPGQWLKIPAGSAELPVMVFGKEMTVRAPQPPGVVVTRIEKLHRGMITNPNLVILPNGDYLVSCSVPGATVFSLSQDKGQTWKEWSRLEMPMTFTKVFVHKGALYLMGIRNPQDTEDGKGLLCVSRSDDGGKTWTAIVDENQGVAMRGHFHSAPVAMVEHDGRLWRGVEVRDGNVKNPAVIGVCVVSAPVDADLLKAASWTKSGMVPVGKPDMIEGNVVVGPDGKMKDILRYSKYDGTEQAAVVSVDGPNAVRFDGASDFVNFPGGAKKFTVQYDPVSKLYWAISNPADPADAARSHPGRFENGVHNGLLRNRMALVSSPDLKTWTVKDWLIVSDNPFFDGFQYVDWKIDGDDIVAVSRTAFAEARGLPVRQHDANLLTFHRFKNFRTEKIPTIELHTLPKPVE